MITFWSTVHCKLILTPLILFGKKNHLLPCFFKQNEGSENLFAKMWELICNALYVWLTSSYVKEWKRVLHEIYITFFHKAFLYIHDTISCVEITPNHSDSGKYWGWVVCLYSLMFLWSHWCFTYQFNHISQICAFQSMSYVQTQVRIH